MSRIALLVVLPIVVACGGDNQPSSAPVAPAVPPAQVSVDQFKSLKWLEGRWRGTTSENRSFFEEYRFVNDSTIRTIDFADSTLKSPRDTGTIALRGGTVANGPVGGEQWFVLTALDSVSVRFEPRGKAVNAFTWKRDADGWIATLGWKNPSGVAVQQVYVMRRLP